MWDPAHSAVAPADHTARRTAACVVADNIVGDTLRRRPCVAGSVTQAWHTPLPRQ
jgi:hypothetical protein